MPTSLGGLLLMGTHQQHVFVVDVCVLDAFHPHQSVLIYSNLTAAMIALLGRIVFSAAATQESLTHLILDSFLSL